MDLKPPLNAQTCSLHFPGDRFLSPHCSHRHYDRRASLLSSCARRRGFLARPCTERSGLRGAWLCKESQLPLSTFCRLEILFPVSTSRLNVETEAEAPGFLAPLSFRPFLASAPRQLWDQIRRLPPWFFLLCSGPWGTPLSSSLTQPGT